MAGPLAMVCMVMVYDSIMNMTRRLTRKITIKLSKFGKQVTWLNGPRVLTLLWAPGCSVHRGCLSHGGGEGEMLWVPPSRTFLGTKNGGGNTSPTPRGATSTGRGGAAGLAPCVWPRVCPEQSLAAGGSACAAALGATCPLIEVYLAI